LSYISFTHIIHILTSNSIRAGLKNQTPVVEGKLVGTIKTKDSNWTIQRDGTVPVDHLVVTLVPEDIEKFISSQDGTQYNFIGGPRIDDDSSTIDVLSKQIVGENIASLPMMNPFGQLSYDDFGEDDDPLDRDAAEQKIQAFLDAMMNGHMDELEDGDNGMDDDEHDIHEIDEDEEIEIKREQHRRKMESEGEIRRSALRNSNKRVSFSIPDGTSGEFRLDGNPSNPPPPAEKKKDNKNDGFRFNFDSKPKTKSNGGNRSSSNQEIIAQDGSLIEPILLSAQETYSNWKYQIWMGAALFAAFQINSWLSK